MTFRCASGLTDGGLVCLDLSQQVSLAQLLSHFLLPALHRAHRHGGGEGRERDLEEARGERQESNLVQTELSNAAVTPLVL